MTISYYDANKKRFREPVFQKTRAVYKSNRSSENENLDSESMLVDVARLYEEIDNLDETILDKITYFIGDPADYTQAAKLLDGISYNLSGIEIKFEETASIQSLSIDTTNKLSGRLSRLLNKVSRLENGN